MQTHIHPLPIAAFCLAIGATGNEAAVAAIFAMAPDGFKALQTLIDMKNGKKPLQNWPRWLEVIEGPIHSIPLWSAATILSTTIAFLAGGTFMVIAPAAGLLSHVLLDRLFHGDPKRYTLAKHDPTMFWPFKINMDKFFGIKIFGHRIFTHDYRLSEGLKIIPEKWPEKIVALVAVTIIVIRLTN